VVPPSIHPTGQPYQWCAGFAPDDVELAPAPGWLLELLTPTLRLPVPHRPMPRRGPYPTQYIQVAIERECMAVAMTPEGSRNDRLYRAALNLGRFVARGEAEAAPVVGALAHAAVFSGLGEREIIATIASAFRARGVL
jgi:hypothetical protein